MEDGAPAAGSTPAVRAVPIGNIPAHTEQLAFDYGALDAETRIVIQQRTGEIKSLMKRAAQDIIDIGQKLIEVKARIGHGRFGAWLAAEFDWSYPTAARLMQVATAFGQNYQIDNFAPSALYLLAAPSTPEAARAEAIDRAVAGEPITHASAREIVAAHRAAPEVVDPPDTADSPSYWDDEGDLDEMEVRANPEGYLLHVAATAGQYGHDSLKAGLSSAARNVARILAEPVTRELTDEEIAAGPPDRASHQLINASTNNEWYTPRPFLDAAHEVMGGIDLDPASNPLANETVRATRYHTIHDDGLSQDWRGRIWLNPPYGREDGKGNQARWSRKLIDAYTAGGVTEAILLVNAVTGNGWFEPLKDYPICFPDGRIRFYNETTEAGAPTHSNALVYFGPNLAGFVRVFSRFGAVVARLAERDGRVSIQGAGGGHA